MDSHGSFVENALELANPQDGFDIGAGENMMVLPSSTLLIMTPGRFNLMELPSEIRLKILEHLIICTEEIKIPKETPGVSPSCPSIAILQTCKQINGEGIEILYRKNKFKVSLPKDPTATNTPIRANPLFLLSGFRWSTISQITHLSFVSNSACLPPSISSLGPYTRPSFICSGANITARFTDRDIRYSPYGPDKNMALSVLNWVSTKVMRAELSACVNELQRIMSPVVVYEHVVLGDTPT